MDYTSQIIRLLDDQEFFDDFQDCDGRLKIVKDDLGITRELPFISVSIENQGCSAITGIETGYLVFRIFGEPTMRDGMYTIADFIKELLCNVSCLPACGSLPTARFCIIADYNLEWTYDPVACSNILILSTRVSF